MGAFFSSSRRKKTLNVLEDLEKKIHSIEQYSFSTEQRRRRAVGLFMVFSMGVYVLAVIIVYFTVRFATWRDVLVYFTPLFLFPFIIIFVRRILTYYYEWKLDSNKNKLIDMRAEKKRILEDIMQNESYKYAKEILDKFGETKETPPPVVNYSPQTPVKAIMTTPANVTPQLRHRPPIGRQSLNSLQSYTGTPAKLGFEPLLDQNKMTPMKIQPQLPRPVLHSEGAFDRLLNYLIGDGPSSRYALICSKCTGHNGMALPEEFEYISYRCAHCHYPNPARKQKPKAPSMLLTPVHRSIPLELGSSSDHKSDSEEEKNSTKDSDEDAIPTPLDNLPEKNENGIGGATNHENTESDDGAKTE